MKLNTESALLDQNNNNGMTLLGFKTILHTQCRSDQSPSRINQKVETMHQERVAKSS
jgi:hypothetical protein